MEKKKGFKLASTAASKPATPELLFNDLKTRSKQIQHLWAHQADLLRSYAKEHKRKDIALELPTGAGKTLIGSLIGEWRRLFYGDRVLYLCPTKQLAYQASARAKEYGIKAGVLVGSKKDYDPDTLAAYQASKAVLVSTYSSVFNIAPGLTDAQVIMLDDAHAAENYVAKMWSIPVSRSDHAELYKALVTVFSGALPNYMPPILANENAAPDQKQSVEMVSGVEFHDRRDEVENLLEDYYEKLRGKPNVSGDAVFWGWKTVQGHLEACNVFVSWDEILIRPWIAPSIANEAFSEATQRIYMSATLGDGGDLERSLGITNIFRIPVPAGWDKQGSGRRLILFPSRSLQNNQADNAIVELIGSKERAIVMAPSTKLMKKFESLASTAKLPHKILHSQEIEDSLDVFTGSKKAILCVSGRYDGIDLPDDSCRIGVLFGLPSTVSLQEDFLWSKLKLSKVLKDRIRTRIVQGCGRCTRNATDYAVVILATGKMLDFMAQTAVQALLHPELRAEVRFGLDNSDGFEKPNDLTELCDVFLQRGEDWEAPEKSILQLRSELNVERPEYIKQLHAVAQHEVKYQYNLWSGAYSAAFEEATQVVDGLSGDELAGYRCLWNYFAGCAAHIAFVSEGKKDARMQKRAADRFKRASQSMMTLPWFARLRYSGVPVEPGTESSRYTGVLVQNIDEQLSDLQYVGKRFPKRIESFQELIQSDDPDEFDRGLTELGNFLGYRASKPQGQAEPDSVWSLANERFIVFETKPEETPDDPISVTTCRQARGHEKWLREQPMIPGNAKVTTIVVSPRSVLAKEALPHADNLFYVPIAEMRKLATTTIANLRSTRSKAADLDVEDRLPIILEGAMGSALTHEALHERLTKKRLNEITVR
jgi:hypothetical protein